MVDVYDQVTIGMAVMPERLPNLEEILPRLLPQCHKLYIHINGPCVIPRWIINEAKIVISQSEANLGDAMKFVGIQNAQGYYCTVDDDILYPDDYIERLIKELKKKDNRAIICVQGGIFNPYLNPEGFNHRNCHLHFTDEVAYSRRVLLAGTGTSCMHVSTFVITPDECRHPNMADVWLSCKAALLNIPIFCIDRPANWLMPLSECGTAINQRNPFSVMDQIIKPSISSFKKTYALHVKETKSRFHETSPVSSNVQASHDPENVLPHVSVILPTYNRKGGLMRALQSLVAQDYPVFDVVVINDGGSDVQDVIETFDDKLDLTYIKQAKNRGPAAARNRGLECARGSYIAYLEDDDRYLPHHVSLLTTLAGMYPDCVGWYTSSIELKVKLINNQFHLQGQPGKTGSPFNRAELLEDYDYIRHNTLMHPKWIAECEAYDEHLMALEDWEYQLRMSRYGSFRFFGRVTVEHTVRIGSPAQHRGDREGVERCKSAVYSRYSETRFEHETVERMA